MQLDGKPGPRSQTATRNFNFDFGDRSTFMAEPPTERESSDCTLLRNPPKVDPLPC